MWLIGYFLGLIFNGESRKVAALVIIVHACSLGEHLILRPQRQLGLGPLNRLYDNESQFSFDTMQTKINVAKAIFLVSAALICLYWPLSMLS